MAWDSPLPSLPTFYSKIQLQVHGASSPSHTPMSVYIERRVKERLKGLKADAEAETLPIRVLSNVKVRAFDEKFDRRDPRAPATSDPGDTLMYLN